MTDRLTDEQIEAVCEALEANVASLTDRGYIPSAKWNALLFTAIRQLQNPWMPIETAPRDGTQIVAYGTCRQIYAPDGWLVAGQKFCCAMAWVGNEWDAGWNGAIPMPTHWQPHPTPPKG
jgi:hypothetical protein